MAKMNKKTKNTPMSFINNISKLYDAQMRLEMLRNGMKTSYRHLLHPLSVKDGVTQLDLVKITRLKAPTVSTTLRNMETDGLITRRTDKDDARAIRVFITEKGREIDKKIRSSGAKIEKNILTGISETDKEQLIKLLSELKVNMEKISGISADEIHIEEV
jgi:MarR family transcriptional regulator for hemolysin